MRVSTFENNLSIAFPTGPAFGWARLLLCCCFICFWGSTSNLLAQQPTYTISGTYNRTPLKTVLYEWQAQYQVYFSFKKRAVEKVEVTAKLKNATLEDALAEVLRGKPLRYTIRSGRFVVIAAKEALPRLCGWLGDSLTREPVMYASLRMPTHGVGTLSQRDGSFALTGDWHPEDVVRISHIGYESIDVSVAQLQGRPCATLWLTPKPIKATEIIISDYLTDGISVEDGAMVLRPARVPALPGLAEPDVFRLVQVLPGVSNPEETAVGIHIRGGTPDQTLLRYNGIPLYQTGHFFEMISAINPYAIETGRVYRSGFPAGTSGRVAGLVDISQGDSIPQQAQYGASLNFTHMGLDVKAPLFGKKAALFLSARRSLTEVFFSPTFERFVDRVFQDSRIADQLEDDEAHLEQDSYAFRDASARLIWQPAPRHNLAFSGFWGRNQLDYSVEYPEEETFMEDYLSINNLGFNATWDYTGPGIYSTHNSLSYSLYSSGYVYNWEENLAAGEWQIEGLIKENAVSDLRLHTAHTWALSSRHRLQVGYESMWQASGYDVNYSSIWGDHEEVLLRQP